MGRLRRSARDATADAVFNAVGSCPACATPPSSQHRYAPFASTVLTEGRISFVREFERGFVAREWATVRTFQDFDHTEDDAQVMAMECSGGLIVMLLLRDPFELWASMSLRRAIVLTEGETAAVRQLLAPDVWKPL